LVEGYNRKRKSLLKGTDLLGGFTFKNLRMAFFHGHLRKVRVMLKSLPCDWIVREIKSRIDSYGSDV